MGGVLAPVMSGDESSRWAFAASLGFALACRADRAGSSCLLMCDTGGVYSRIHFLFQVVGVSH